MSGATTAQTLRTHYCGDAGEKLPGQTVTGCGRVNRRRDRASKNPDHGAGGN